jgi:hypothetical protein
MGDRDARKVDERRWRLTIVRHLEDLPRQYAALENAMAAFGEDFDLQQFKAASNNTEDMDAYNRVQAVERALERVQNYVGELADAGAKLVGLPRPPMESDASQAQHAFEALRDAGVIGRGLREVGESPDRSDENRAQLCPEDGGRCPSRRDARTGPSA